jgi:hypothetical protein
MKAVLSLPHEAGQDVTQNIHLLLQLSTKQII